MIENLSQGHYRGFKEILFKFKYIFFTNNRNAEITNFKLRRIIKQLQLQ